MKLVQSTDCRAVELKLCVMQMYEVVVIAMLFVFLSFHIA